MKMLSKLIIIILSFTLYVSPLLATKLMEVQVIDQDYVMLHFVDSEVEYLDDGLGAGAFSNFYLGLNNNTLVTYGSALNTTLAQQNGTWTISSSDDANYSGGLNPTAVYRKSKSNGQAQFEWVVANNDFRYEYGYQHYVYLRVPQAMQQGKNYTINIGGGTNSDQATVNFEFDIFNNRSEAVHVNRVGYSTASSIKAADLYHWLGDGGARDYSSFEGNDVYIYNIVTGVSQPVGTVSFWSTQDQDVGFYDFTKSSVWNADFTGFNTPGLYRIAIDGIGCSDDFEIKQDIYYEPFKISTLGFFYMRIGQDSVGISPVPRRPLYNPKTSNTRVILTTLHPQHPDWDALSAANGDLWDAPNVFANYIQPGSPENPNATGGHSDAYDWDRHIGHVSIIYDMLLPYYLSNGDIDDDDLGIAESGNGIPDILDEARYEVDYWLSLRDGAGYGSGLTNPDDSDIIYQAGATALSAWANAANCAMMAACFEIDGNTYLKNYYQTEAITAYNHAASLPDQMLNDVQGVGDTNMKGRDFKMMAAAFLYNLTGNTVYENAVNAESVVTNANTEIIRFIFGDEANDYNQIWGTAAYLLTTRPINYPTLHANMKASVIASAKSQEADWTLTRPSRRASDFLAGYFHTAQNVHRTMVAHRVTTNPTEKAFFENALILEADWGLGRNPLNMIQMTTGSTSLQNERSVSQIYTTGMDDGTPDVHPGHTPYLNTDAWACSFVSGCPPSLYNQNYPAFINWPVGEDYYETRYVWAHTEFTPQQTMRGKMALYGYLYALVATPSNNTNLYNLIVNEGTGDGAYAATTVVNIRAAAPAPSMVFKEWIGDIATIANVNSASTTVTMIASDPVEVTATYEPIPIVGAGICSDPIFFTCGQQISYTSIGASNNYENYQGAYAPYNGPDVVHAVTMDAGSITITLDGFGADLDLFLMDDCDPANATLLAESTNGPGQSESIIINSLVAGTYYIFVDGFDNASDDYSLLINCPAAATSKISLRPKVYLQGAYNGTNMNHTLDAVMPTTEPYSGLGYSFVNGGGGETTTTTIINDHNIVDWVLVELRDKNNASIVVAACAALLKSDGTIVSHTDGISPVEFDAPADDYYIAVQHRNHLGVMTNTLVRLD